MNPPVSAPMLSAKPGVLLAGEQAEHSLGYEVPLASALNVVGSNVLKGSYRAWPIDVLKRPGYECLDPMSNQYYSRM